MIADIDLYLLRAFLAVAEIGTVNGAAGALCRTQTAVSMQIRKLEGIVGAALFERSTRGLDLTVKGQMLAPFAREIIKMNEDILRRLSGNILEGRIRFGVVEDFAATKLINILRTFRDQNPKVDIDIIVESNRRLASLFDEDQLDLVVCDCQCLERKPLLNWTEHLRWAVRSDVIVDTDSPLPIVLFEESCPWQMKTIEALSDRNVRWKVACVASTLVAMATAVRVGIGIGPMLTDTIPEDCRVLGAGADLPGAVRIEIGLYARSGVSEETRYLIEFISRQSLISS